MAIDKAKWHSDGEYPADLPPENGGTHIGVFLAWAVLNGLDGDDLRADGAESLDRLRRREITGRDLLFRECDGMLIRDDLSEVGWKFARAYYTTYQSDYSRVVGNELPSIYHAADTWELYEAVAPVIDKRFAAWKRKRDEREVG